MMTSIRPRNGQSGQGTTLALFGRGVLGYAIRAIMLLRLCKRSAPKVLKVFTALIVVGSFAFAEGNADDIAAICDRAAAQASRETGVPLSVLRAITLTETGRQKNGSFRPWPWTVNMEGTGVWFDTPDEAKAYVFKHHARGARSFDVGCFQLNFRWHGQGFSSIEEMFEPLPNARYAAGFLSDLHKEFGDWSRAAGAYHSRTPRYANRYRARFDRIRARLDDTPPPEGPLVAEATNPPAPEPEAVVPVAVPEPRVNNFPLLQANAAPSGLGSLVPLGGVSSSSLFAQPAPVPEVEDAG